MLKHFVTSVGVRVYLRSQRVKRQLTKYHLKESFQCLGAMLLGAEQDPWVSSERDPFAGDN